jgi:hypothetical protein
MGRRTIHNSGGKNNSEFQKSGRDEPWNSSRPHADATRVAEAQRPISHLKTSIATLVTMCVTGSCFSDILLTSFLGNK